MLMDSEEDPVEWMEDELASAGVENPAKKLELALSSSDLQQADAITDLFTDYSSSDYVTRTKLVYQLLNNESTLLQKVIEFLKKSVSVHLGSNICKFLHICLSPSNKETRMALLKSLVALNTVEVLFRLLAAYDPQTKWDDSFLPIVQVLAKLCSKDGTSSIKARLIGAVKPLHATILCAPKGNKIILPTLLLIRAASKNATNQLYFGSLGCLSTLFSLWGSISKNNWLQTKVIVEILSRLVKTRSNIGRLLKENGLLRLLNVIESWEKINKKHQFKLLRASFITIKHVIETKTARNTLISLRGVDCLQRFASMCSTDRKFDSLFNTAIYILLTCFSSASLPLTTIRRNVNFVHKVPLKPSANDFDTDSDEDVGKSDTENDVKCDTFSNFRCNAVMMTDLSKFNVFFPEFNDFHVLPSSLMKYPSRRNDARNKNQGYMDATSNTKSIFKFVKIAYPDLIQAESVQKAEPLYENSQNVYRVKQLECLKKILTQPKENEKIVFDFDFLVESDRCHDLPNSTKPLVNLDLKRIGQHEQITAHLNFESRFEGGNLRRAIQVSGKEYDLLLNPDMNSCYHHQWFYFEVSNMEAQVPYTFNIINNEKSNSEFNYGMKPVLFSVTEAFNGSPHWIRAGSNICYYRNQYRQYYKSTKFVADRRSSTCNHYSATFTVEFPHSDDVCYLAYHYPYTYSKLQTFLSSVSISSKVFYTNQLLCRTLNENCVPLLTITSKEGAAKDKEIIFLTSRVHPGESNSSWMMEGIISTLLRESSLAEKLNRKYIFKIIPMLNPEGTIHGNQRCGLSNEDLNRCWLSPNPQIHPSIYSTKALIEYVTTVFGKKPLVFCDLHGHSRQKNIFMYGCSRESSWLSADRASHSPDTHHILPSLACQHMSTFCLKNCLYRIERERESTARVTVWRQFKIPYSYTIEVSTSGCNFGIHKGNHLNTHLLLEAGSGFCTALLELSSELRNSSKINQQRHHEEQSSLLPGIMSESDSDTDFDLYGVSS